MTDENIRLRGRSLPDQIRVPRTSSRQMARYLRLRYFSTPGCKCARRPFSGLYFGYLAAIKEQNGAAMSSGPTCAPSWISTSSATSKRASCTEEQAQELMDHFVHEAAHGPFSCARRNTTSCSRAIPTWVTESIGGMGRGRQTPRDAKPPSASSTRSYNLRPCARTEPDRALERASAGGLQEASARKVSIDTDCHPV